MQVLDLEKQLMEWKLDPESFATRFGFRLPRSGNVARVNTAPQKVVFYGREFVGSFIFDEDELKHVVLIPVLKDVDIPNYPSEEYQQIKMFYCESFLKGIFGEEATLLSDGMQWTTDRCVIGCYAINEGKDKYTGGNITIDMRQTI